MRKRSLILLLLPIVIILWTIGWAFLWTGTQQTGRKQQTTRQQDDNIHITVKLPEQKQEITE
jgi:flagellar basal body-associated protein FliL